MAKIKVSKGSKAYPKNSTDGFMGNRSSKGKKRGSNGRLLGPQLVVDGEFYTGNRWVIGAGWTIGSGQAVGVAGTDSAITQPTTRIIDGEDYQVDIGVVANAGTVKVQFTSGTPVESADLGTGTYTFDMTGDAGNTNFAVRKDIAFDGYVDYLSIRQVIPKA